MRLPCIRSPENYEIRLFDFAVGTRPSTRSKNGRQTDDARSMSGPITGVDVVCTQDGAHELLGEVIDLVGRLGAGKKSNGTWPVTFDDFSETARGSV
jgi:hypothetical protein